MTHNGCARRYGRRTFLKIGGLAVAGATAGAVARSLPGGGVGWTRAIPEPLTAQIHLAATDGFIYIPGSQPNPAGPMPFLPDSLADPPFTMWGFGFRDVTGFDTTQVQAQRGKFQASAPLLWVNELDAVGITLTNLGLSVRPDLTDSHTIHWHGFRNAIPLFDGVPEVSIAVPLGRDFTYFYRPRDPGTYMYHCHFEDTEHVSMGMTGIIFVRPAQNQGNDGLGIPVARVVDPDSDGPMGYAYNDGVPPSNARSTAYDREYGMFLSEAWTQEHWEGAHIQEHDWSDYDADVWLLNGRPYPLTVAPNGQGHDVSGDLVAPDGYPELQYQPISSLVNANEGDRVLLRFVNLGFQQQAMTIDAITMRIVGKDATFLRGRDGTDLALDANTVYIGPGESVDAIFTAPTVSTETTFLLYNRNLAYLHNPGLAGLGGQMTEIHIFPGTAVDPQSIPNT